MAQNKLNALHLHLTDGESFSVNTEKWPTFSNLSVKGAYSPALSYSKADLEAVVARGRLRGVRVIPEFDLPAHMASWAQGYEGLITDCPSVNPHPEWPRYYSPADVTNPLLVSNPATRQLLRALPRTAGFRVSWGPLLCFFLAPSKSHDSSHDTVLLRARSMLQLRRF